MRRHIRDRLAFSRILLARVLLLLLLKVLQVLDLITSELLRREKLAVILPRLHHGILPIGTLVHILTVLACF